MLSLFLTCSPSVRVTHLAHSHSDVESTSNMRNPDIPFVEVGDRKGNINGGAVVSEGSPVVYIS